jgi:hypothetical protein
LTGYSAVLPGDPGYNYALHSFVRNPSPANNQATLSNLGAYVDLNYMYPIDSTGVTWATALEKYARALYGINSAVINPTYGSNTGNGYNYYFTNNHIGAMGQSQLLPLPWFHLNSNPQSSIFTRVLDLPTGVYPAPYGSIWDTWSTHYEHDGLDNDLDGLIDEGVDGMDNPSNTNISAAAGSATNKLRPIGGLLEAFSNFGVDDPSEMEAPPPYRYPLRGIQIKVRAFESDTKQVREVTIVHEFLQE